MTLSRYTIKLGLTDSDLHRIIESANTGMTLREIKEREAKHLSIRQIYAILVKYCKEDSSGEISDLYPEIYNEFVEEVDESIISKDIVISRNNKQLADTYYDLSLKERETEDKS